MQQAAKEAGAAEALQTAAAHNQAAKQDQAMTLALVDTVSAAATASKDQVSALLSALERCQEPNLQRAIVAVLAKVCATQDSMPTHLLRSNALPALASVVSAACVSADSEQSAVAAAVADAATTGDGVAEATAVAALDATWMVLSNAEATADIVDKTNVSVPLAENFEASVRRLQRRQTPKPAATAMSADDLLLSAVRPLVCATALSAAAVEATAARAGIFDALCAASQQAKSGSLQRNLARLWATLAGASAGARRMTDKGAAALAALLAGNDPKITQLVAVTVGRFAAAQDDASGLQLPQISPVSPQTVTEPWRGAVERMTGSDLAAALAKLCSSSKQSQTAAATTLAALAVTPVAVDQLLQRGVAAALGDVLDKSSSSTARRAALCGLSRLAGSDKQCDAVAAVAADIVSAFAANDHHDEALRTLASDVYERIMRPQRQRDAEARRLREEEEERQRAAAEAERLRLIEEERLRAEDEARREAELARLRTEAEEQRRLQERERPHADSVWFEQYNRALQRRLIAQAREGKPLTAPAAAEVIPQRSARHKNRRRHGR